MITDLSMVDPCRSQLSRTAVRAYNPSLLFPYHELGGRKQSKPRSTIFTRAELVVLQDAWAFSTWVLPCESRNGFLPGPREHGECRGYHQSKGIFLGRSKKKIRNRCSISKLLLLLVQETIRTVTKSAFETKKKTSAARKRNDWINLHCIVKAIRAWNITSQRHRRIFSRQYC